MLAGAGLLSRTILGELSDDTNRVQCESTWLWSQARAVESTPWSGSELTGSGYAVFSPALTVGLTLG